MAAIATLEDARCQTNTSDKKATGLLKKLLTRNPKNQLTSLSPLQVIG